MMRAAFLAMVAVFTAWATAPIRADDKPADPLPEGSTWKGKLTQEGLGGGGVEDALEYEVEFVVTKRKGKTFEAELREKSETRQVTYLVKGTVTAAKEDGAYKVEFESHDSKDVGENTGAITNIPYTGVIKGKKFKGEWKYPKNDQGITLEGDFILKLKE